MKKFYVGCAVLILSALLTFSGCFSGSSKVLNYLKNTKEFEYEKTGSGYYKISFTVNRDSSYNLSIILKYGGTEPDITCEGKLEYFGDYENHFTTEWLGVTQNNVNYYYAIKLTEAAEAMNEDRDLFLIAAADSKLAASFSTHLVFYAADNPDRDASDYVRAMSERSADYIIKPKE